MTRKGGDVLLVHRPRYDDWSFPKGKLDPGEHAVAAAVREVAEETGLDVRLGPPLPGQRYVIATGRTKAVSYWTARVVGDDDVELLPGQRRDRRGRLGRRWDEARARLTYDHDRDTLDAARAAAPARPGPWWCCGTARPAPARPGAATTAAGRCWCPAASRPSGWSRCWPASG